MGVMSGHEQTVIGGTPEGWVAGSLSYFLALQRGHDLTVRDRRLGDVPVMGSAGRNGFHDRALVRGPGVILGRSGASFGQAHYCEADFWPHNTALYVTDFRGNHPLFAFYFLKNIDFSRHNSGGAQQSLNRNFIAPILVAFPKREEQEVIAQALSDADALIESLEQLLAKKRQMKQGAMQDLFTGKKRLPGFTGPWLVTCFEQIATRRSQRVDPTEANHDFCIELEHIQPGTGELIGHSVTSAGSSLKSVFKVGDVLFGKLRAYLRKFWLADRPGVCSTEFWCLSARGPLKANALLFHLVQMDSFIEAASMAYGTHMPRSDWNSVKGYTMELPVEEAEQVAIASVLSDMDTELAALQTQLSKARQLKQGMMQVLLTGQIRLI